MEPVPPPLTNSSGCDGLDGGDGGRPPLGQLPGRQALHGAERGTLEGRPRLVVAQAGDLALVRHDPGELEAGPPGDRPGEFRGLPGGVHGGAVRAQVEAPAGQFQRGVQVDADAEVRAVRAPRPRP